MNRWLAFNGQGQISFSSQLLRRRPDHHQTNNMVRCSQPGAHANKVTVYTTCGARGTLLNDITLARSPNDDTGGTSRSHMLHTPDTTACVHAQLLR